MSNQAGRETAAHSHASAVSASGLEFAETSSVTLEWRLTGLKEIYESTKGDAKSKCHRSAIFGDADDLWEILFYPNSGSNNGEFASLYLSAVPTQREKDQAINKRWVRKGLWWFKLEVKTSPDPASGKSVIISTKDASDHTFALKTANWGWQSFAKRDHLFTTQPLCIALDTLIITCTIQAQPQPPAGFWLGLSRDMPSYTDSTPSGGGLSAWAGADGASGRVAGGATAAAEPMAVVPASLLAAIASMLNYDDYADVEFVLPAPAYEDSDDETAEPDTKRPPRKIYATEAMLARLEYFNLMFSWEEDDEQRLTSEAPLDDAICDSDQEEERQKPRRSQQRSSVNSLTTSELPHPVDGFPNTTPATSLPDVHDMALAQSVGEERSYNSGGESDAKSIAASDDAQMSDAEAEPKPLRSTAPESSCKEPRRNGPKKRKVIVTDAALSTWYAIIYWIYTDRIVFAPLSSTFNSGPLALPADAKLRSLKSGSSTPSHSTEYKTRHEWIEAWLRERRSVEMDANLIDPWTEPRNGLVPVSAKAVYRLADKMDIEPLKLRAYQHIMANLTIENCPFELFSMFSSVYASIRKVQMAFFLKNWGEIRKSDALKQIWTQIRLGRHVGFEEGKIHVMVES